MRSCVATQALHIFLITDENGTRHGKPKDIAETFNQFFANIDPSSATPSPHLHQHHKRVNLPLSNVDYWSIVRREHAN